MSFYKQPYSYQCGPFALKYALVMLGIIESEQAIEEYAGTSWWYGTDEIGLAKAAKRFKCNFLDINVSNNATKSVSNLKKYLKQGLPAILCVDNWSHWITVTNYKADNFVCIDSERTKVVMILSKKELLDRWKFTEEGISYYSGYILIPYKKPKILAKFTLNTARKLMQDNYQELAYNWGNYFNALISITKVKTHASENIISFSEFIRRYKKIIISNILKHYKHVKKADIIEKLNHLLFISNVYNLGIQTSNIASALISITCILTSYLPTPNTKLNFGIRI